MMCSSLIQEDYATFDVYFKRDLLTLVDDKVITVRMTLVRILTTHPIEDKDISRALFKLAKDKCGDIRELVA
jgi:ABC-type thiamine transport system ATPase subunit